MPHFLLSSTALRTILGGLTVDMPVGCWISLSKSCIRRFGIGTGWNWAWNVNGHWDFGTSSSWYFQPLTYRWKTHSPLLDSLSIKPSSIIFFRWVILCSSSGAMIPAVSFWRSGGTREGKRRMSSGWLQVCQVKRAKNDVFIYPDGSTSPTIDPWDTKCIPSNSRRMVSCEFSSMSSILAWMRRDKAGTLTKGITYMNCD